MNNVVSNQNLNEVETDGNNVVGTFRLVENHADLSFLIRINPRCLHQRYLLSPLNLKELNH